MIRPFGSGSLQNLLDRHSHQFGVPANAARVRLIQGATDMLSFPLNIAAVREDQRPQTEFEFCTGD
jgi:hypothetical protein